MRATLLATPRREKVALLHARAAAHGVGTATAAEKGRSATPVDFQRIVTLQLTSKRITKTLIYKFPGNPSHEHSQGHTEAKSNELVTMGDCNLELSLATTHT